MDKKEILKDKRLNLPIQYTGDCENAICTILDKFVGILNDYKVNISVIDDVKGFKENIKKMFSEYFLGHHGKAFEMFKMALEHLKKNNELFITDVPNETFYRARVYTNKEMFHIPYENRGKVSTQRFSFPGLPCLYLGMSSYVCWLETNRPQFNQFQVAAIRRKNPENDLKVINLALHPLAVYEQLKNETIYDLEAYLRLWPIIATSSMVVKNEDDSFKPEYIFPQFMLQYILENSDDDTLIGIKYFSMKAGNISQSQYKNEKRLYTNYVFPIRSNTPTPDGFCKFLDDEFTIVKNYSGRELEVLTDSIRKSGITLETFDNAEKEKDPLDMALLFDSNKLSYSYKKTIFRRIEIILNNKDNNCYSDEGELILQPISNEGIGQLYK